MTAIFLFVFVVQLFIQGVHEMAEQGYLPYSTIIHDATESWGPDSAFGHLLTYLLVILPLGWLLMSKLTGRSIFNKTVDSAAHWRGARPRAARATSTGRAAWRSS